MDRSRIPIFMNLLASILFMASLETATAETGTLAGAVTDKSTGEPLPGASVSIEGTELDATADEKGAYFVDNVPIGTYSINVEMMGYISVSKADVAVKAGQRTIVDFKLGPTVFKLEEVVVTAEKPLKGIQNVVFQEEIAKPKTSRTADGLLENLAGIDVARTSPGGDRGGTVSIRGFSEERSLIMLDGRPLNGSGVYGGHYVDWSSLSVEDIERIEVVRGAKSAEYGSTLGGAINIVTKKGLKKPKTQLNLSYGAEDTRYHMLSHSGGYRSVLYSLSVGRWQTDGYLRNNDISRNTFAGRVTVPVGYEATLALRARYTLHERGFIVDNETDSPYYDSSYPVSSGSAGGGPGISFKGGEYYWGDESYWKNIRKQYDLELEKGFGSLDLEALAYLNDQDRTEYFYAITDKDKLIYERFAKPEDKTWGWSLKASQPVRRHDLVYGIEGFYLGTGGIEDKYVDEEYFTRAPASVGLETEHRTRRHAAFVQDRWSIASYLDLDVGLRYDHYYADETAATRPSKVTEGKLSPKFGSTFKAWEGGEIEISLCRAYRFPTSPESYWYFGGYDPMEQGIEREPLTPEDALQTEVGLSHKFAAMGRIRLTGYYYDVDDYIRVILGYMPSRVVYNIDEVKLRGVEVEGDYHVAEGFSLFGNYTYQTSKKKGDILDKSSAVTERLPELPEHKTNMGLRFRARNGATADLTLRYVGKKDILTGSLTKEGAAELEHIDPFATVGLNAQYPILKKERFQAKLRLGIENLFDEEYKEQFGFPMPGRTVTGGIDMTL
jgi:outer membrane receptor protein involved in Fe transport